MGIKYCSINTDIIGISRICLKLSGDEVIKRCILLNHVMCVYNQLGCLEYLARFHVKH